MNITTKPAADDPTESLLFRHFCRSVAEIQWLLVILVLLYAMLSGQELDSSPALVVTIAGYFVFSLGSNYLTFFALNRRFLIALHTLLMLAFITTVIYLTDGIRGPLVGLYLVAIITSALALGKLATLLEVAAIGGCYLLLMQYQGGGIALDHETLSLIAANLVTFLLVGYLTTTLAEAIHAANEGLKALPRLQRSMEATIQRWQYVVNQSGDAFIEVDSNGHVTEWNPRASLIFGWSQKEAFGRPLSDLVISPAQRRPEFESMARLLGDTSYSPRPDERIKTRLMRRDGSIFPAEILVHDINLPDHRYFNAFVHDISAQEAEHTQLIQRAHVDAVTQLANRHVLEERVSQVLSRPHRDTISLLILLDLDNFKRVNDNHGHAIGDHLLREVGARITGVVRDRDLVARMSGDEFTVLMEQIKPLSNDQLQQIAEKIIKSCAQPYDMGDITIEITVSLGLAIYRGGEETRFQWLREADDAMYSAKRAGKNRFAIYSSASHAARGSDRLSASA